MNIKYDKILLIMILSYVYLQNMIWSFGMNKHVPVLNLTDEARKMIMYACAHTGVLYDIVNNKQTLLQGHVSNFIKYDFLEWEILVNVNLIFTLSSADK